MKISLNTVVQASLLLGAILFIGGLASIIDHEDKSLVFNMRSISFVVGILILSATMIVSMIEPSNWIDYDRIMGPDGYRPCPHCQKTELKRMDFSSSLIRCQDCNQLFLSTKHLWCFSGFLQVPKKDHQRIIQEVKQQKEVNTLHILKV